MVDSPTSRQTEPRVGFHFLTAQRIWGWLLSSASDANSCLACFPTPPPGLGGNKIKRRPGRHVLVLPGRAEVRHGEDFPRLWGTAPAEDEAPPPRRTFSGGRGRSRRPDPKRPSRSRRAAGPGRAAGGAAAAAVQAAAVGRAPDLRPPPCAAVRAGGPRLRTRPTRPRAHRRLPQPPPDAWTGRSAGGTAGPGLTASARLAPQPRRPGQEPWGPVREEGTLSTHRLGPGAPEPPVFPPQASQ